jgi:hypothetical protein
MDAAQLITVAALAVIALIGIDLLRELARPQPRRARYRRR